MRQLESECSDRNLVTCDHHSSDRIRADDPIDKPADVWPGWGHADGADFDLAGDRRPGGRRRWHADYGRQPVSRAARRLLGHGEHTGWHEPDVHAASARTARPVV